MSSSSNLDSGGSGDGGLLSRFVQTAGLSSLTTRPWVRLDLFGLLTAIVSGVVLGFFDGVVGYVTAIGRGLQRIAGGIATALAEGANLVFGGATAAGGVWDSAAAALSDFGPFAFIAAIIITGITMYVISLGVEAVVE